MTTDKATARPWAVGSHPNNGAGTNWRTIVATDLPFSPSYVGEAQLQDADLIVCAVNSHDALVKALKTCRFELLSIVPHVTSGYAKNLQGAADVAKAALKLAEGR